jgi:uncharacterized protein DUF1206
MGTVTRGSPGAEETDMAGAQETLKQAGDSVWLERGVRVGLLAYGVVHLIIAWLALQLAFGNSSSSSANQQGAMHELAKQPLGSALLWVVAVGLFALAIWKVTDALWGHREKDEPKRLFSRLGSAGTAVVYIAIGISAAKVAIGAGSKSHSKQMTAQLMQLPFGRVLVAIVGVVVLIVAGVHAKRGITASFTKHLDAGATSGSSGSLITRLGQAGYISKGVSLGVIGGLFIWAAWTYDPKKAGGLDTALHSLLGQPFGPWLLAIVAVGIACFGLYCFGWARYADTDSGQRQPGRGRLG